MKSLKGPSFIIVACAAWLFAACQNDVWSYDASAQDTSTPDSEVEDASLPDSEVALSDSEVEVSDSEVEVSDSGGTDSGCGTGCPERGFCCGAVCCPDGTLCGPEGSCLRSTNNPVISRDGPDPAVLRMQDADGDFTFYLTHTVHNRGDLPVYVSNDLLSWERTDDGLFGRERSNGSSLQINDFHYCSLWAPQVVELGPSSFLLSFSAQRYAGAQNPCPNYGDNGGVYMAWSSSPTGPFAPTEHPWEPFPAGANEERCAADLREQIPHSLDFTSSGCQGNYCHKIVRLDSEVWRDPADGRWWLAYSWYTNRPPMVPWEETNYGQHVGLVELEASDPFAVRCDLDVPQIHVGNPQDSETLAALADSCEGCDEMLSFTRGKWGEEVLREGYSWGVNEGAGLFRHGDYVYLLMSGSMWDSPYYHVFWVAAPTVEGLALGNDSRLEGRYLIPSGDQAFGHGAPALGPDSERWYYVYHRLDSVACQEGDCSRDVWISPIEFEDRGDGLGPVHIRPRWPARDPAVTVSLPPISE